MENLFENLRKFFKDNTMKLELEGRLYRDSVNATVQTSDAHLRRALCPRREILTELYFIGQLTRTHLTNYTSTLMLND